MFNRVNTAGPTPPLNELTVIKHRMGMQTATIAGLKILSATRNILSVQSILRHHTDDPRLPSHLCLNIGRSVDCEVFSGLYILAL